MTDANAHCSTDQIAATFLRTFCRGANLRALFSQQLFSLPVLRDLKQAFNKYIKKDFRGSLANELLSAEFEQHPSEVATWGTLSKPTRLEPVLYIALARRLNEDPTRFATYTTSNSKVDQHTVLLSPHIQDCAKLHAKGVVFSTSAESVGNSLVIFKSSPTNTPTAGQIKRIFVHSRPSSSGTSHTEAFCVVQEFLPLNDLEAAADPYRVFPLIDAKIYRQELSAQAHVIQLQNIIAHFASYLIKLDSCKDNCQVVLSLDRVGVSYNRFVAETYWYLRRTYGIYLIYEGTVHLGMGDAPQPGFS